VMGAREGSDIVDRIDDATRASIRGWACAAPGDTRSNCVRLT